MATPLTSATIAAGSDSRCSLPFSTPNAAIVAPTNAPPISKRMSRSPRCPEGTFIALYATVIVSGSQRLFMTVLKGAQVLITGAAGGFGRQMIRQFSAAGCQLLIHDRDSAQLAAAATDTDVLARFVSDLSTSAGCAELVRDVRQSGHDVDVLINNAGIGVGGRFDEVPDDRWEQVIDVNLLAPMYLCRAYMPSMMQRRTGHIVNISSVAGLIGARNVASYSAAKFGLRGFGEALAEEVREFGVKVSTVFPWFSKTPILESEYFGSQQRLDVPADIVTDPADVVAAIVRGIENDRELIYPDSMSRRIQFVKRHFPRLTTYMMRRQLTSILPAKES